MVIWNWDITDRTIKSFYFRDVDDFISIFWSNMEPKQLVFNIHLYLSMSTAVVGIVNGLSKYLMIQRIIKSCRKGGIKRG